jgi:F-type H+-transporting ATPase subunit b
MELLTPGLGLIFWQLVGFLLLLFLLGKFAWRPILSALKSREQSIAEALESAENARKEMENLKADNQKLIDEARKEREKMLKDAMAAAQKIKDDANEDASNRASKIIEEAKVSIENEKQAALADVKQQVAALAVQIAEKILKEQLSNQKDQEKYVSDLVEDLDV